jgi:hypothetical protein
VRRDLAGALRVLVVPTIALAAVAAFVPGRLELATRVYALVLCAVALALALLVLRRAYPPAHPLRPRVRAARTHRRPPPTLARIEHEAALGVAGSFDLHFRLVPRLRAIAAGLLTARRQISLDGDSPAAHEIVGDATFELLRADRPPPEDRLGRGIAAQDLGLVVDSLERI